MQDMKGRGMSFLKKRLRASILKLSKQYDSQPSMLVYIVYIEYYSYYKTIVHILYQRSLRYF